MMRSIRNEKLKKYWEKREQQYELDKKNYVGPHCCLDMHYAVDKKNTENTSPCSYNPRFRGYYLDATIGPGGRQIPYCPFCSAKLPNVLSDEWFAIIRNELHLNPWDPDDREKIPGEFLTDEWWKKRNL